MIYASIEHVEAINDAKHNFTFGHRGALYTQALLLSLGVEAAAVDRFLCENVAQHLTFKGMRGNDTTTFAGHSAHKDAPSASLTAWLEIINNQTEGDT